MLENKRRKASRKEGLTMAKNTFNGWAKKFFVGLAIAGFIWKAAILQNDVKHIKADIVEIKTMLRAK